MKPRILSASLAGLLIASSPAGEDNRTDVYSEHRVVFRGTLYRQNIHQGDFRVQKTRVGTKDILRILEVELGRDFGREAHLLVVENYTSTVPEEHRTSISNWNWCVRTHSKEVIDVSEYFAYLPAPDSNTVVDEKGRNQTVYGLDEVFIGTELLFFDFSGVAQFTISESVFRRDKVPNRVFQEHTHLGHVAGEAQTTEPPRTYPMDGKFTVKSGKVKHD